MSILGISIEKDRLYTEEQLRKIGLFTTESLRRARENGLRCKEIRRGHRVYMGEWLLQWIQGGGEDENSSADGG